MTSQTEIGIADFLITLSIFRKAYRDAVAQAGTGPALATIRDWIKEEKVKSEEAAELVAVLPFTARTPTPEYVDALFVSTINGTLLHIFKNTVI